MLHIIYISFSAVIRFHRVIDVALSSSSFRAIRGTENREHPAHDLSCCMLCKSNECACMCADVNVCINPLGRVGFHNRYI